MDFVTYVLALTPIAAFERNVDNDISLISSLHTNAWYLKYLSVDKATIKL